MFKILLLLFGIGTTLALNVQSKNEGIDNRLTPELKARFDAAYSVVENVNLADAGWEARMYPRFARMTEDELRAMNGLIIDENETPHEEEPFEVTPILIKAEDLPEEFDPRQQFPQCASVIDNIRDQSRCGSCWAVAAAGAISDRICMKSKGHVNVSVSDLDIASCAMKGRNGCAGAPSLAPAWEYMHRHGTVTGDKYHTDIGCKPYPFPPAKQAKRSFHTPTCMEQCSNILYDEKSYVDDLIKVGKPIRLRAMDGPNMEHVIMQEVYVNGSVEVGFLVYEDFVYYSSGVYQHTTGEQRGGHAVRLIGWGVENGTTPYWLIANSWGPEWGENGFFRIRRGVDEAGIESMTSPYVAEPIL